MAAAPQWKPFVEPYRQVFPSLEIATANMEATAANPGVGMHDQRARNPATADQPTVTGILPMRACHSRGPVWCTLVPPASTATVTGMSCTSNS